METMRSYAIVPAAGHGRRLGGDKLLLPCRGETILECVLRAWKNSDVSKIIVVIRKNDQPAAAIARRMGVDVICPENNPRDMKASVQAGLKYAEENHAPLDEDVWMLAPADMPRLTAADVNGVLAEHDSEVPAIIVPEFDGQAGHPVLFPWAMRRQVFQLNDGEGINLLVRRSPSRRIVLSSRRCLEDVDTEQAYQQLLSAPPKVR